MRKFFKNPYNSFEILLISNESFVSKPIFEILKKKIFGFANTFLVGNPNYSFVRVLTDVWKQFQAAILTCKREMLFNVDKMTFKWNHNEACHPSLSYSFSSCITIIKVQCERINLNLYWYKNQLFVQYFHQQAGNTILT